MQIFNLLWQTPTAIVFSSLTGAVISGTYRAYRGPSTQPIEVKALLLATTAGLFATSTLLLAGVSKTARDILTILCFLFGGAAAYLENKQA